jgi:hypothetical protein
LKCNIKKAVTFTLQYFFSLRKKKGFFIKVFNGTTKEMHCKNITRHGNVGRTDPIWEISRRRELIQHLLRQKGYKTPGRATNSGK